MTRNLESVLKGGLILKLRWDKGSGRFRADLYEEGSMSSATVYGDTWGTTLTDAFLAHLGDEKEGADDAG